MYAISTNLDFFVKLSNSTQLSVGDLNVYFTEMSTWCSANLVCNTWYFSNYISVMDSTNNEAVLARTIEFSEHEDATAFSIRFGIKFGDVVKA